MKRKRTTIRKSMIRNIKAYNKDFEEEALDKKSNIELLNHCHPLDRIDFAKLLFEKGKITEIELKKVKNGVSQSY